MKRLEIYVGWTCNQECTYCIELGTMKKKWNTKITKYKILKELIKYKKLGYNHVTYLGGEPFIQDVFFDALKIGKRLGYTILVTTNATTLHLEQQAKIYLPYINELIISVEALEKNLQQKISQVNIFVEWEKVFANIGKYWDGNMLKVNIVITKDNLEELLNIVKFLNEKRIKNIAITYPDIDLGYYTKQYIIEKVAPKYIECKYNLQKVVKFCKKNRINLKLADFPLCLFEGEDIAHYIRISDDYNYQDRLKISSKNKKWYRGTSKMVRDKCYLPKCDECKNILYCKGVGEEYNIVHPNFIVKPF